jgi:hypothetical protein
MNGTGVVGYDAMFVSGAVGGRSQPAHRPRIEMHVWVARGLLYRDDLLQKVDSGVTKLVTIISAAPGNGKTSLVPDWVEHSTNPRAADVSGGRIGRPS